MARLQLDPPGVLPLLGSRVEHQDIGFRLLPIFLLLIAESVLDHVAASLGGQGHDHIGGGRFDGRLAR